MILDVKHLFIEIQWNLSNVTNLGADKSGHFIEVVTLQDEDTLSHLKHT